MASRLNPYINFTGNAREVLEFYREVFGGELRLMTYGDVGTPPESGLTDKIMHGQLETERDFTLMCGDVPPDMEYKPGTNISVSLSGDDADDLRRYWNALSEGGTVTVALEKQVWGDEFGACVDRFGVSWMVNITQPVA